MKPSGFFIPCLTILVIFSSCDSKTTVVDACGDHFVDPGEECDGPVGDVTCASLGHYNLSGTPVCLANCTLDVSSCGGRCGDGNTDSSDAEDCDGADLNGNSCQTLGASGGNLACKADCTFDTSGCLNVCGNGVLEGEEACDDTDPDPGDGCSDNCTVETGWECDSASPSVCTPICGDGMIVGDEQCDGANLDDSTCTSLGFYDGTLACESLTCRFDTDSCEQAGRCGDGELQPEHGEVCDGQNLNDTDCADRGFHGGTLACADDCQSYDETGCLGRCGDNIAQTGDGELCDGQDLAGNTCESQGYHGGALACIATCDGFNLTSCIAVGRCGDGLLQQAFGEVCDSSNLNAQTCQSQGQYAGTLACGSDCLFDLSGCGGRCGDGAIQAPFGEQCDGANLNGQSCTSRGYYGGTLTCTAGCAFDESSCAGVGRCGDATIQPSFSEVCDGANLDGETCTSLGWHTGSLACSPDCRSLDETACAINGRCGDGALQPTWEQCDGTLFGGTTCQTLGYYTGTLSCNSSCQRVTSGCSLRCGDGIVQTTYGEQCDGSNLNSQTCVTLGLRAGTLSCGSTCQFNTNLCGGRCGDGVIQSTYEECDGSALGGQTCTSLGYFGGTLSCDGSCQFAEGNCLTVLSVSAGALHTCAVRSNGTIVCWGNNTLGQLGNGSSVFSSSVPVVVSGITTATAVFSGTNHSCARLSSGAVQCWGGNSYGQLGNGSSADSNIPVSVTGITTATTLALSDHSCAVLSNGTVQCWGWNLMGQLGDGSQTNRNTPVTVTGLSSVAAIAVGTYHSCVRLTDNTARCWGGNGDGQLGNGGSGLSLTPVTVSGLTGVTSITAHRFHSCARIQGSTARCWGDNTKGQLGDGTTTDRNTPVTVSGLTNALTVSAGYEHTCARMNDNTVRCWGSNTYGQLGNNSLIDSTTPVTVQGLSGTSFLVSGDMHNCAIAESSKAIYCWGDNRYYILGDRTQTTRTTPVRVIP